MWSGKRKRAFYNLANFARIKKFESQKLITTTNQEIIKTKIYSTYNNEILAEFVVNKVGKNTRETINNRQNMIKINNNPKLP